VYPPWKCPLHRPLEPTREFQPDFETGTLDAMYGNILKPKEDFPELVPRSGCDSGEGCVPQGSRSGDKVWYALLALILAVLLVYGKSIL